MIVTIETANARRARIAEIAGILEKKQPELHAHNALVDNWQNQINHIQLQLDKDAHRAPHEIRTGSLSNDEKKQMARQIRALREQLNDALAVYEPMRDEVDALEAEQRDLYRNPPAPRATDLKEAHDYIGAMNVKIEQIKQAAEQAASKAPDVNTDVMATAIDTLLAERDLMAADVDMGSKPEGDLKKITAQLARAKKDLTDAQDVAGIAEATQRGYQRRLDSLESELHTATAGFETMLSLWARDAYQGEAKRLQAAIQNTEKALNSMASYNELSLLSGDGSQLFSYSASVRIEPRGITGFDNETFTPDTDAARKSAEQMLAKVINGRD
jgi:DNA repair exonuclease SbcCD ATPase subunit